MPTCARTAPTILASTLMALACTTHAAPPVASPPSPAAAPVSPGLTPEARGRALLKAQLAALSDNDAFAATFAPDATVLTSSNANGVHESDSQAAAVIASLNPHAQIKSATFDHFFVGIAGQLIWIAADLHITVSSHEPESPPSTSSTTVRAIELLDGTLGWKVAVAAFTEVAQLHKTGSCSIHNLTEVGPLSQLLTSPTAMSDALGEGAVVYGTDPGERGLGTKDARALLAKWKNLTITLDAPPQVHEMRGGRFGYTMAKLHVTTKPGSTRRESRAEGSHSTVHSPSRSR